MVFLPLSCLRCTQGSRYFRFIRLDSLSMKQTDLNFVTCALVSLLRMLSGQVNLILRLRELAGRTVTDVRDLKDQLENYFV